MKQAIISVFLMALLVLAPVGAIAFAQNNEAQAAPAAAEPIINCTDITVGQQVRIRCTAAGLVVLNTTVNLPVIEIPVPGPTRTIRVTLPGDRETVTVPGPTKTVTVPGPTKTVEAGTEIEAPTETVTIKEPGETTTVRPNGSPVPTATATSTVTTTVTATPRQTGTRSGTIETREEGDDIVVTIPKTELDTPEAVGLGTLAIILIATLIILGMYAGYYMGYKDSEKAEAKFFRSLLRK